jgi:hypothetical protein
MATYYFVGGEDHDFTKLGICSVDTATANTRRTANNRCSLKVGNASNSLISDGWTGTLSAPQSSFWLSTRYVYTGFTSTNSYLMSFFDAAGTRRLYIMGTNQGFTLYKVSSTNVSTSLGILNSGANPPATLTKVDVFINYAVAGSIQVYWDNTLVFNYSGDITTNGATALASFTLGSVGGNTSNYWSEVVASDSDTRSTSIITLAPSANGNAFTFDSGSVASISETTLDDTSLISSGTAGQLAQFTVGSAGVTGSLAIKAVVISARAAKGGTGPQNAKFNVRTGSANYASAAIALPGTFGRVQGVFTANPASSSPWVNADLTAAGFNVGIQSEA